jgi:hypothetical protein
MGAFIMPDYLTLYFELLQSVIDTLIQTQDAQRKDEEQAIADKKNIPFQPEEDAKI